MKKALTLLGPPGSGKTTVADNIGFEGRIDIIKTGPLLKKEIGQASEISKEIEIYINRGDLVPSEYVAKVIDKKMSGLGEDIELIVFDGFPRLKEEIDILFEVLKTNSFKLEGVILLELSRRQAYNRLVDRMHCSNCGAIYNLRYYPPPKKEAALDKRMDDYPTVIDSQLDEYESRTLKVVDHFRDKYPDFLMEIDADNSLFKIFSDLHRYLENIGIDI